MSIKSIVLAASIMALSPALLSGTALADKGGKGHGKDKSYERHYNDDDDSYHHHSDDDDVTIIIDTDRDHIRNYIRDDYRTHCPPGLAKKRNGCMPPGQAKKYRVGYPLSSDVIFVPVPDDLLVHLRPIPRGYQYVQVDKDVLLIAEASKKVIDAVTLLSAVGN